MGDGFCENGLLRVCRSVRLCVPKLDLEMLWCANERYKDKSNYFSLHVLSLMDSCGGRHKLYAFPSYQLPK